MLGGVEERPALAGLEFEPDFALLPRSAPELAALAAELGESAALRRGAFEGLTVVRGGKRTWTSFSARLGVGQALAQRRLRALLRWFGPSLDPRVPERGVRLDDRSVADFAKLHLGRRALAERFAPLFAPYL